MAKPILVEIFADATQFQQELGKAAGTTRRFGAVAKTLGVALAGVLVVGLEKSVAAAIDAQDSQRRLEQAFRNTGLSADTYRQQIDDAESSSRALGFTGNDVRDALGTLLTATGSVTTSINDLAVAQDLARFKGIDLETATRTLTGAMSGSQRAIRQLGLSISPVTAAVDALKASHTDLSTAAGKAELAQAKLADKMATGQAVISAVSDLVRGQGQAYADTAAGGMAQFHAQLDNLEVTIGTALLPALTELLTNASSLALFLTTNLGPTINNIKDFLGHFEGAARLLGDYLKLEMKVIIGAWKLELSAAEAVVKAVKVALNAMHTAATTVSDFLRDVFHGVINTTKSAVSALGDVVDGVKSGLGGVHSAGKTLAGWFEGAGKTAFNAFKSVANGVASAIETIASALRAVVSAARSVASALSSIHVPHISLPSVGGLLGHIPHAAGGSVVPGQSYLVGERGPELFTSGASGFITPNNMLGGGGVIENNIHVILDGKEIWASVQRQGVNYSARNAAPGIA